MKRIDELFDVRYGVNLELNALTLCDAGSKYAVNFIARTSRNNGLTAIVERRADIEPIPAGTLTVAGGGAVLETFLQNEPYYSGRDLFYLTPRVTMTDEIKLYYCACVRANKYRYAYGRQANKTLHEIKIPDISEIPDFVKNSTMPDCSYVTKPLCEEKLELNTQNWKAFRYDEIFYIEKGERITKLDLIPGETPFIGAIDKNNGIRQFAGIVPLYREGAITVNYNGSVGDAFYQDKPFWASDDINVLIPKFKFNKYIAFFFITLIKREKYRYNYGRKWHKERMEESIFRLPVTKNGSPDFDFMERYIKSVPYSAGI